MSVGESILLAIVTMFLGAILGAVASWYFSRRYYLKAVADSTAALHPLIQAVMALGRMLEKAGLGKLTYDDAGNITGIVITASARSTATFSDRADATVAKGQPPQYDRQHEQPPSPEPEADHAD